MASVVTNVLSGGLLDGVSKIISLFKVSPEIVLEKQTELAEIQLKMQSDAAAAIAQQVSEQVQVNLAEAQNKSIFIAGWRPAVGWACAIAFAYTYILQPFFMFIAVCFHRPDVVQNLPKLDLVSMLPVMGGMLGLAGLRSYDKTQGTDNGH